MTPSEERQIVVRVNLEQRLEFQKACQISAEARASSIELCQRDIIHFFKYWLWTYDPRISPSDIPFIPYEYQESEIRERNKDIEQGTSCLTEKTRDMGVTWYTLGVFVYRWLFKGENFLLGSKTESAVDTIGDISTHFERLRYMISKLPDWMVQELGYSRKNSGYMKIFKESGASLVGESMNSNFSRQGRYKAILLDEFAFVDGARNIWRATGDAAPCKLPVSTPNGRNNFFSELRHSGKIKVSTLHWKLHPLKTPEWYEQQKMNRGAKDIAQELDINYTISAGDPFYVGFSRALHFRRMKISREKPLILGWDYGFRHPNCVVCQLSVEGILIVVDNIFGENQTIDEFGEYVIGYMNEKWDGYQWKGDGFGDPAGKQSSDKSRKSSEQILNEMGFRVKSIPSNAASSSYAARKAIIEKKLRTLIGGIPSLVVNECEGTQIIAEGFEGGYRYPDANKYGGVAEKPIDDGWFEHPFNALEYVIINIFKAVERPTRQVTPMLLRRREQRSAVNGGVSYEE